MMSVHVEQTRLIQFMAYVHDIAFTATQKKRYPGALQEFEGGEKQRWKSVQRKTCESIRRGI